MPLLCPPAAALLLELGLSFQTSGPPCDCDRILYHNLPRQGGPKQGTKVPFFFGLKSLRPGPEYSALEDSRARPICAGPLAGDLLASRCPPSKPGGPPPPGSVPGVSGGCW